MFVRNLCLIVLICLAGQRVGYGDLVSLIPVPGYPGGANVNALAGPLFGSAMDSVSISGPGSGTASASLAGNFATHDYAVELDFSGGSAYFDSMYSSPFSRTATLDHRASAESIFHFSVDVPTAFSIEGFFGAIDDFGTTVPGNVELEIELLEFDHPFDPFGPAPDTVFYNWQVSKTTIDAGFVVGEEAGDTTNSLIGMPTGILDPAKFYRYRTLVTINAIDIDGGGSMPATDGGAIASGGHIIMFSSAAGVPEPASSVLILLGVCLLTQNRNRNRKNTGR